MNEFPKFRFWDVHRAKNADCLTFSPKLAFHVTPPKDIAPTNEPSGRLHKSLKQIRVTPVPPYKMIRFLSNSLNLKQIQPKWTRNSSLSSKLRFLQIFGKYPLVCYRGQLRMLLIVLEYFREPRNKFGAMSEQESVDISWI